MVPAKSNDFVEDGAAQFEPMCGRQVIQNTGRMLGGKKSGRRLDDTESRLFKNQPCPPHVYRMRDQRDAIYPGPAELLSRVPRAFKCVERFFFQPFHIRAEILDECGLHLGGFGRTGAERTAT